MKEHPYEFGGILFTIALLGGILGGVALDNFVEYEYDDKPKSGSGSGSGSWSGQGQGQPSVPRTALDTVLDNYYKNNMDMQLDCKKTSADLQEFYDCVNG